MDSGPDNFTLAICKHSTILGKNIQITITSAQVHNSLRHVYTESLYKVLLAFFTEMGTADSAQGLQSKELDGGKQGPVGSGWPGPKVTWSHSGWCKVQVTSLTRSSARDVRGKGLG